MKYLRFFSDGSAVVENLNVKHYAQFIKDNEIVSYYVKTKLILHNENAGDLKLSFIKSDSSMKYIEYLKISGNLNSTDIKFIRDMCEVNNKYKGKLSVLDIAECNIIEGGDAYLISNGIEYKTRNNDLGEYTFYNTNLLKCTLPNTLTNIETNMFDNSKLLHTIELNKLPIPAASAKLLIQKVNGFLFAKEKFSIDDEYAANVIIENDYNSFVELKDKEDYILDKDIKIKSCSFVKYFFKKTISGQSVGWETLVLPFKPTKIEGKNKLKQDAYLLPFKSNEDEFKDKLVLNFWLRYGSYPVTISVPLENMEINTLYMVAMPNNSANFHDMYNIEGYVYFTGEAKDEDFILLSKTNNEFMLQSYNDELNGLGRYITTHKNDIKQDTLLWMDVNEGAAWLPGDTIYPFQWGLINK